MANNSILRSAESRFSTKYSPRDLKNLLILFILYSAFGLIGLNVNAVNKFASLVWAPSGIAIAALLIFGPQLWPAVFVGAVVVNYLSGAPLWVAFLIAAGNSLEAYCGTLFCRSSKNFDTSLSKPRDVFAVVIGGATIATLLSATIGVTSLEIAGLVPEGQFFFTWFTWWVGDAAGIITVAPLIMVFSSRDTVTKLLWGKRSYIEMLALSATMVAVLAFVFSPTPVFEDYPAMPYIIFPVLLWGTLRFGQRGAVLTTFATSAAAIWATSQDFGPLARGSYQGDLVTLMGFILTVTLTKIIVASVIIDRENTREKLREEAQSASEAKSAFLANMSHEIRTPLGVIMGFSDLIVGNNHSASEKLSFADAIRRNGELLSKLINDILDLSKVEARKLAIEKREVSLEEVISELSTSLSLRASEKGIRLNFDAEGAIPSKIVTDPLRLRQVILNIVGNAIKFTEKGEVNVTIKMLGSKLAIVAKDTGCGISEQQAIKLFSPFVQADASTTRMFGGTGLGLILSRGLARSLGGDVVLNSSQVGKGSEFTITIDPGPLTKTLFKNFDEKGSILSIVRKDEELPSVLVRVLVVDDSHDNQILIKRILELAGAKVDIADDGFKGLRMAKETEYDIILMDLQMPQMDGFEVTKRLRDSGYQKPIIALTAHAMQGDRERCLQHGFNEHIAKPIDKNVLIKAISKFAG